MDRRDTLKSALIAMLGPFAPEAEATDEELQKSLAKFEQHYPGVLGYIVGLFGEGFDE